MDECEALLDGARAAASAAEAGYQQARSELEARCTRLTDVAAVTAKERDEARVERDAARTSARETAAAATEVAR